MRRKVLFFLMVAVLSFAACDRFEDPEIPRINDCSFKLVNNEDIPLSNACIKVFYTDKKPGFVVDSAFTTVLGTGILRSLKPGDYLLKAFMGDQEIGTREYTIQPDNSLNILEWKLDLFIENFPLTVALADNKNKPVTGRKVELYTTDQNPVLIGQLLSDSQGKVVFNKTVTGNYTVLVYDDSNSAVFAQSGVAVGTGLNNSVSFLIRKIFHNADFVITGYLHDPKGSDSPKTGAVSGDGLVHPGQYEYVQLMALKDIDFGATPYSVVFTNSSTPSAYGWADGIYNATSKKVYQINLSKGSVRKGQYFYVGGSARRICSYYKLVLSPQLPETIFWGIDYAAEPGGSNNGAMKDGSGLMANGSGKVQTSVTKAFPDGVALFRGVEVTENSIPMDAVFYGTKLAPTTYQVPENDVYSRTGSNDEPQPTFGTGSNSYLFPVGAEDMGTFIKLGGQVTPTEWLLPRSGSVMVFNLLDKPGASVADIENAADCTLFVDK